MQVQDLDDDDGFGGEECKEEENEENDPLVDPSDVSVSVFQPAPALALGSLGEVAAPKKTIRKRKQASEVEDLDAEDALNIDGQAASPDQADPQIMAVKRLRLLVKDLGCVPPCFWGLVPERILAGEKNGHQLRGARGYENV